MGITKTRGKGTSLHGRSSMKPRLMVVNGGMGLRKLEDINKAQIEKSMEILE